MFQTVWTQIAQTTTHNGGRENIVYIAESPEITGTHLFIRVIGPNVPGVKYSILEFDFDNKRYRSISYCDSADYQYHLSNIGVGPWEVPVKGTIGNILYKEARKRRKK